MPSLLHENATITCPHGGQVRLAPARRAVLAAGASVATLADRVTVSNCPHVPLPCVSVTWQTHAASVTVHGSPALLQGSTAQCRTADGTSQGPLTISVVQQKVTAR